VITYVRVKDLTRHGSIPCVDLDCNFNIFEDGQRGRTCG
jgi:hypothetical protein